MLGATADRSMLFATIRAHDNAGVATERRGGSDSDLCLRSRTPGDHPYGVGPRPPAGRPLRLHAPGLPTIAAGIGVAGPPVHGGARPPGLPARPPLPQRPPRRHRGQHRLRRPGSHRRPPLGLRLGPGQVPGPPAEGPPDDQRRVRGLPRLQRSGEPAAAARHRRQAGLALRRYTGGRGRQGGQARPAPPRGVGGVVPLCGGTRIHALSRSRRGVLGQRLAAGQ